MYNVLKYFTAASLAISGLANCGQAMSQQIGNEANIEVPIGELLRAYTIHPPGHDSILGLSPAIISPEIIIFEGNNPETSGLSLSMVREFWADRQKSYQTILKQITGDLCTATLVGPRTVLTAEHCYRDRNAYFSNSPRDDPEDSEYGKWVVRHAECEGFSSYKENVLKHDKLTDAQRIVLKAKDHSKDETSEDLALCILDEPAVELIFETIDTNSAPPVGTTLGLAGFGCKTRDEESEGIFGIGLSPRISTPVQGPSNDSVIYTKPMPGKSHAALCPGDSGGPAFRYINNNIENRRVVGVNSVGDDESNLSMISPTGTSAASAFFELWIEAHENRYKICGVNYSENCRSLSKNEFVSIHPQTRILETTSFVR